MSNHDTSTQAKTIDEIDFAALYRRHATLSRRARKSVEEWDARAESFAAANHTSLTAPLSPYVAEFIAAIDLSDLPEISERTLLDVGAGSGALALPLSRHFGHVYALDFSPKMLQAIEQSATEEGVENITTLNLAWEDSWESVPSCDIVIASRSTMVEDLADALTKLSNRAKKRVYTTFIVERNFITPDLLQVIDRDPNIGFPDYIYALNWLYQAGFRPTLNYIKTQNCRTPHIETEAELLEAVEWSLGKLNEEERKKLHTFYAEHTAKSDHTPIATRPTEWAWALLSWEC